MNIEKLLNYVTGFSFGLFVAGMLSSFINNSEQG